MRARVRLVLAVLLLSASAVATGHSGENLTDGIALRVSCHEDVQFWDTRKVGENQVDKLVQVGSGSEDSKFVLRPGEVRVIEHLNRPTDPSSKFEFVLDDAYYTLSFLPEPGRGADNQVFVALLQLVNSGTGPAMIPGGPQTFLSYEKAAYDWKGRRITSRVGALEIRERFVIEPAGLQGEPGRTLQLDYDALFVQATNYFWGHSTRKASGVLMECDLELVEAPPAE